MKYYDQSEQEMIESFEASEKWVSAKKNTLAQYKNLAKENLKKSARINIRITVKDLKDVKKMAAMEGLPYQTLVSSVIHKYANRRGDL